MGKTDPVLEIDYKKLGTISTRRVEAGDLGRYPNAPGSVRRRVCDQRQAHRARHQRIWRSLVVKRLSTGATVKRLDTHHYHPACLDYKL